MIYSAHYQPPRKPKRVTINDDDREGFVINEEGLYLAQRRSRLPMRKFIRENRDIIDAAIRKANGESHGT